MRDIKMDLREMGFLGRILKWVFGKWGLGGRILKWVLRKWGLGVWIGFI
jgi:hypothetical protein